MRPVTLSIVLLLQHISTVQHSICFKVQNSTNFMVQNNTRFTVQYHTCFTVYNSTCFNFHGLMRPIFTVQCACFKVQYGTFSLIKRAHISLFNTTYVLRLNKAHFQVQNSKCFMVEYGNSFQDEKQHIMFYDSKQCTFHG